MKYLFLVQGEGRGHMTQAMVLSKMLTTNGHEVTHTFIGISDRRSIPDYFFEQIASDITKIKSPNFILDKKNQSIKLAKSVTYNSRFLTSYKKSLDQIHQKVKETQPDVIINFCDFLGGFYFRIYNPKNVKHVCIGRQFLTFHPDYPFAPDREIEKRLYITNNKITSQKCDKYLALSFRPYSTKKIKKLVVMPPLLKDDLQHTQVKSENFLLGYMVNDGYAEDIMTWHSRNPEVAVHCFWDRKNMPDSFSPRKNLTFHQLNNSLFNDMMRRCKGFFSTAGFESICEAMYLQKPTLMVPVARQYEQACNAIDGEISGAGIKGNSFDISQLIKFLSIYQPNHDFREWVKKTESMFLEELTNF